MGTAAKYIVLPLAQAVALPEDTTEKSMSTLAAGGKLPDPLGDRLGLVLDYGPKWTERCVLRNMTALQ